ncbi:glycoside hydrolase family 15 protein [Agromyces sp. NPDC058110]|uniref:glycoside hydrolase family 15 protein n=1 Tax=Agromyces sp. NPDC058110 TaxID=3346345 RepID=UPI0036D9FFFB
MPAPIEDYAIIGDCRTTAMLDSGGSMDWYCPPRFDAASVFGALLGGPEQGRWLLRPDDAEALGTRRYDGDTFTLVSRWACADGEVEVTELMPTGSGRHDARSDVIRRVRGLSGTVTMRQELRVRFDYAATLPWMRQLGTPDAPALVAVAGPDALVLRGPRLTARGRAHHGSFAVAAGETVDLRLTWFPSHLDVPEPLDVDGAIETTRAWWTDWIDGATWHGAYDDAVRRSLLVLRLLTHEDTGGVVAAATTSLPEEFGGSRNWDYRYVWLRDASLTLQALLRHGLVAEAEHWRSWLVRAVAGDPADVQIMYGVAGERRLPEWQVGDLPGYGGASPVRVGNAAAEQFQSDVFGEVLTALDAVRHDGSDDDRFAWPLQRALLGEAERRLDRADSGIWEIRGAERHFTHSRVMLWAAFDRAVCAVEQDGRDGPVELWRDIRSTLAERIERTGFDPGLGSYVQSEGSGEADAALLQLPQVGYVAADDPRMLGTVAHLERTLMRGGLLRRYRTEAEIDGVEGDENAFVACSFWLVEQYARSGRLADAEQLMERLLAFANDLGLLSEQVDPATGRQAGNTPQALSHLALVRAADAIGDARRRTA